MYRHNRIGWAEDPEVFRGLFYLNKNRRLVFTRLKIGDDRGREQDEQKREDDEHPANADNAPIIEEMQLNFVLLCHRNPCGESKESTKNPQEVNRPAAGCSRT